MNAFHYAWMYMTGSARWDSGIVPPEVERAFAEAGRIPPGPALDLGCGTGTNAVYMARQGRQVWGLDFALPALLRARMKARRAGLGGQVRFLAADVTRLEALKLPRMAYALDMGCFHGLDQAGQTAYARGLGGLLAPGGVFMLYALEPHMREGISSGVSAERVREVFATWFRVEDWQTGFFQERRSNWFWLRRLDDGDDST